MSLPTFSQLLTEHLLRSGISDSELARSIGVRRQTVFRWKEGLVERPRVRDDVIRCATKLRLSAEERDLLLLVAGFAPEALAPDALQAASTSLEASSLDEDASAPQSVDVEESEPEALGDSAHLAAGDKPSHLQNEQPATPAGVDPARFASQLGAAQNPNTLVTHETTAPFTLTTAQEPHAETMEPAISAAADPLQWQAASTSGVVTAIRAIMAVSADGAVIRAASPMNPVAQWFTRRTPRGFLSLGILLILFLLIAVLGWGLSGLVRPDPSPTPGVVQVPLNPPRSTPGGFPAIYPAAQPGETLLIVAPFRGYTVNEQYNVAGRIREVLVEEIAAAKLLSTTIAIWPEELSNAGQLGPVLTASGAALVIWGEYDSGRVRVNLDGQRTDGQDDLTIKRDFPLSSPAELITTITSTLPKEIRILALNVLGRLLRNQGDYVKATNAFEQALRLKPEDAKITALLYFYLGHMAEQGRTVADYSRALDYYGHALAANPQLIDALYNQGTVHLNYTYLLTVDDPLWRTNIDAAVADLTAVITVRSSYLAAYHNRGVAYYERNSAGDQEAAMADFSHIIATKPTNERAYFHRALASLRANTGRAWITDFEETLAINADYSPAINGLCWGYALSEEPETALPFCDQAVTLDRTGTSYDSRAIVYAQLGRYADAITDFNAYLRWVEGLGSTTLYERYRGPMVETWITQLQAGENPFDRTLLDALR